MNLVETILSEHFYHIPIYKAYISVKNLYFKENESEIHDILIFFFL